MYASIVCTEIMISKCTACILSLVDLDTTPHSTR